MFDLIREVFLRRAQDVKRAHDLYQSFVVGPQVARVGMHASHAIAHRLGCGLSVEQSAAREYLYRWNLALRSPVFGVPHTLGL